MTLLVAITGWEVEPWLERFRRLLPDRPVVALGEPFDRRSVHYAATWKHPPGSLAGLPNLEAVFSLGAGVDHLMGDPRLPEVPVVRVVDPDLTNRMSEYVVLHCLLHLRGQRRYDAQQTRREWRDDRHQPAARDVRVGVLGLGVLGRDAASKLAAMGFDVAGWSRTPKPDAGVPAFHGEEGLGAFLARTDILVCLLPLTEETRGFLNRGLFGRLARDGRLGGPVLINAGRGGQQVEADILACLDDGTLHAATLDVFETEPLPADSALWAHPAVTVTPHNAAMSDPETIGRLVAEQIRRFEAGEPLRDVVDRRLGY
jgi:glyoxylate/hydroxypyruvate reductase A